MQLLWKEWRQQKQLFLLGSLAGISFPVFELLVYYKYRHGLSGTGLGGAVVGMLGAFFAILLAVATTSDDTRAGVDDFWQSKPIQSWKLFTAKFLLAVLILPASFLFVMSPDFITGYYTQGKFAYSNWAVFCFTYPIALMVFAATMLFTVLLRDAAKAVLMAIWLGLLIYFLPLLVRQLDWMNVFEQLDNASHASVLEYLLFVAVAVSASIVCVILCVVAFERKWRWCPGQKTIAWITGFSAAFIFGLSMLQAGSNLGPVTTHNSKEIISEISFREKPLNKYDWTGQTLGDDEIYREPSNPAAACFKGEFMFRISTGTQMSKELLNPKLMHGGDPDLPRLNWKTPLKEHFFLDIYHLPYTKEGFHLSETRFFVGRNQPQKVLGCFVRDKRLYVSYRPQSPVKPEDAGRAAQAPVRFLIVDVSDPNQPRRISDEVISQPKTWSGGIMVNYRQYCYIHDGDQLLILSVERPDEPEIAGRIDKNSFGNELTQWAPQQMSVIGNRLICNDGERILIFDLTEPANPRPIYSGSISNWWVPGEENMIRAITCANEIMYVATKSGLFVFELRPDQNGMLTAGTIGRRGATAIERLAGRSPRKLMLKNNFLVEGAGGFGVLVYDVSDSTRPGRAYHGQTPSYITDIGIWDGLVYMVNYGQDIVFLDIPRVK